MLGSLQLCLVQILLDFTTDLLGTASVKKKKGLLQFLVGLLWLSRVSLYPQKPSALFVWIHRETRSPSHVGTLTAWSVSRSTGISLTIWEFTAALNAEQPSHRGPCCDAIYRMSITSPAANFQNSRLSPTCIGSPSVISAWVGATRRSSPASCAWLTTVKPTSNHITSRPPSSVTSWWTKLATWTGRSARSTRRAWSCSAAQTRCAYVYCALFESTAATISPLRRRSASTNRYNARVSFKLWVHKTFWTGCEKSHLVISWDMAIIIQNSNDCLPYSVVIGQTKHQLSDARARIALLHHCQRRLEQVWRWHWSGTGQKSSWINEWMNVLVLFHKLKQCKI